MAPLWVGPIWLTVRTKAEPEMGLLAQPGCVLANIPVIGDAEAALFGAVKP
jgi:hypothetical protein